MEANGLVHGEYLSVGGVKRIHKPIFFVRFSRVIKVMLVNSLGFVSTYFNP